VSLYLLGKYRVWGLGFLATACVAALCYYLAHPVRGVGIALPTFVPGIAAAILALLFSRPYAAPLAYIAGSLGTLIGADLLNLGLVQGLGAPVASIGGAGTFDGIFVTAILAVLIAGIGAARPRPDASGAPPAARA
jgi:uncharacterized membrane protein